MIKPAFVTFIVFALIFQEGIAQSIDREFGAVSVEEVALQHYEKDPEASAVVLFDIGKSVFIERNNNFEIEFTRTKRIKILTKAGLDFAELSIPYYQDGYGKTELVKDIKAFTYNLEFGKIKKTPLDKKNIFVDKRSENWFVKKFAMPEVKEGSVIEIQYTLKTPFKFNLPDWEFQDRIPTEYSEYETRMIPFYEYSYILQGASKFDHFESYESPGVYRQFGVHEFREMVYKFAMEDVPAFRDETYISSINDYIVKLDFQLSRFTNYDGVRTEIITTWPEMTNDLLKHDSFGKYIKASEKACRKVVSEELALSGKNDLEKCEAIVNYVKSNFSWSGYSAKYTTKNVKNFLKDKTGNSAEINLFLTGMLQAAGFESHPVLLSTRDHGKIPYDYPFSHFFNETVTIVKVGGNFILTDGTDGFTQFNRIPYRCINGKGLIVDKDSELWVNLNHNAPSILQESLVLEILPEKDSVMGRISKEMTEYVALKYRSAFQNKPEEISKFLLDAGFNQVKGVTTVNYDNLKAPYGLVFNAKMPISRFENKLLVSPFLNLPVRDNLLKQEKRVYPVDMVYQERRIFKSQIMVPESYAVSKLPESYFYEDELIHINYSAKEDEGIISSEGSYYFKKSVYEPVEYQTLKSHIDQLVKVFNEEIVFVKQD